jgi:hypothetical protein
LKAKPPATRRRTSKRTELRRAAAQTARRLANEAAEREWRLGLTAKFDRIWNSMTKFRVKLGAARFRDLMADVPDALAEVGTVGHPRLVEFCLLLGDDFRAFLDDITEALDAASDPGTFSAKWIDVVCERTKTKTDGPEGLT